MIRKGAALLEMLIAAMLTSIVTATAVAVLRTQSQVAHQTTARSERNDGVRTAALIMRAELEAVDPRVDVRAFARDSITSRIFRGVAIVCERRDSTAFVRYRGLRLPDPAKDSAVQVGVEDVRRVGNVREENACFAAPDERVLAMDLSTIPFIGAVWLIFENGSYQLQSNALRYRRDAESRQPVTSEIIDVRRSAFLFHADSVLRSLEMRLTQRSGAKSAATIRFLNGG